MIDTLPPGTKRMTVADLYQRFGPIHLDRIRFDPWPGTATEQDLLRFSAKDDRLYELVDGILVEKCMGLAESLLATTIITALQVWVKPRKLGKVAAPDATIRFFPGLVRLPDVAFIPWSSFPEGRLGRQQVQRVIPALVIEILSPGNTRKEMKNKRKVYFKAGVQLVWEIGPRKRTAEVFTSPDKSAVLTAKQSLDGGKVLPGFTLSLSELFAELDEEAPQAGVKPRS